MLPIRKIAARLKIKDKYLIPYGKYLAKIDLALLTEIAKQKRGKYILVTAITPTLLGEGKTVTTIGLSMALNKLGKFSSACLRQPSLGPVFGIKGGGAGGGKSCVMPHEDVNLHLTGDFHAVSIAHNLAAAYLDNCVFQGNPGKIDQGAISWRRVVDVNDRALRKITTCQDAKDRCISRVTGFDITAASELMAILALASGLEDLRKRIGRIVLADKLDGGYFTAEDLKVAGSMAVLLKDAIKPNLAQTSENTPCFVHTGPFANIAHGNNSIIADQIALGLSDYVVTESGFGADCGAEKFFDIKCRISGLVPDAVVLVCSVKALKAHSALSALEEGLYNLEKQIENVLRFGIPVVVAINRFASDTQREIDLIRKKSLEFGAVDCQVSTVYKDGSKGGIALAKSVINASRLKSDFKFLYSLDKPIKEKIEIIAKNIYGAAGVEYSDEAENKIGLYTKRSWDKLPICMAKTQLSLSHDPQLKGRPRNFSLPIRDIRAAVGAGFLYPLCGQMQTMPGLPGCPAGQGIDIDAKGNIIGLR